MSMFTQSASAGMVLAEIAEAEKISVQNGIRDFTGLYWSIGLLVDRSEPCGGWSDEALNGLLSEIRLALPGNSEITASGLRQMQGFFRAYPHGMTLEQARSRRGSRRRDPDADSDRID